MADETEVIREKMEATREDLSDKLEKLENKVVGSVEDATAAVSETVQSAKEVVTNVKETVQNTVDSVKDAASNAAEGVRQTVANTAETLRDTFDLPAQVDRHPWLMVGGAVAVGFVAGKLLDYGPEAAEAFEAMGETTGRFARSTADTASTAMSTVGSAAATGASWWSAFESAFGPELNKVKELALGALVGAVRDVAVQAAPETMRRHIGDVFDSFTSKLGGRPIEGTVLGPRPAEEEAPNGPGRRF